MRLVTYLTKSEIMQKKITETWHIWVHILEYFAKALQWIPTWQGLDDFRISLHPCALDESRLSIGKVDVRKGHAILCLWFSVRWWFSQGQWRLSWFWQKKHQDKQNSRFGYNWPGPSNTKNMLIHFLSQLRPSWVGTFITPLDSSL